MGPRGKEGLGWLSFWEFLHPWALPSMRQEGKLIISCLNIWSSKGDKSRRDIRPSVLGGGGPYYWVHGGYSWTKVPSPLG